MDLRSITYTDGDGVARNAYDYLMEDGGDIPGGRYATRCMDAADIAIMLFLIHVHANGEDSIDLLDGCMSEVVNGGDEVCWTVLDNRYALEGITVEIGGWGRPRKTVPLDPTIYFDDEEIEYARELYAAAYGGEKPSF